MQSHMGCGDDSQMKERLLRESDQGCDNSSMSMASEHSLPMWNRRPGNGKHVYRKELSMIRQKPSLGVVKQERGRELWLARLNRGVVRRAMLFFSYIDIN